MPDGPWYESVEGEALEQGDILRGCDVIVPIESDPAPPSDEAPEASLPAASESASESDSSDEAAGAGQDEDAASSDGVSVELTIRDVVVMTQSCDLLNEKVEDVLVAEVIEWDAWLRSEADAGRGLGAGQQRTWRKKLVRGEFPSFSLLHEHEGDPGLGWSIVDFRKLYMVRKPLLQQHARESGTRLRLVPPYREHLSQAFARYFMRVGLPHEARAFEDYATLT